MARKKAPEGLAKDKREHEFLVVGIGASAGGVKALTEFFSGMPPDSGMAFVVILHLSEEYKSNLAEILQRTTSMPVGQVNEAVEVQPNHVYVIPPAKHLVMVDGHIGLRDPEKVKGIRVPIDRFFKTLAETYRTMAVSIILSGTGTDGTAGMKHIKGQDGFAIVQDPRDAEYDGMPRSAIETRVADVVMHVSEMPEKLISVRDSTEKFGLTNGHEAAVSDEIKNLELLSDVLSVLRVRTGHDFSNYKRPTVIRRVARHLQIHETDDLAVYLKILREKPEEVLSLLKNLLINVTNFFRDKEAFAILEKKVIPAIFVGKSAEDHVRVWTAGCATGEEAYSIAFLLDEYAATLAEPPNIQIFASDVDPDAIAEAREGRFTEAVVTDLSPERLRQFFVKEEFHYRVRKTIREKILFASHNILRDPPFSKVDLVSCRNVLIYLNRDAQDRVLEVFHFALRENGYLFLGSSESAEGLGGSFVSVDKKHRIYQSRPSNTSWSGPPQMSVHSVRTPRHGQAPSHRAQAHLQSFEELHHRLMQEYAPASVLVNDDGDILHLSENAGKFLRFAGGSPSSNLLKVVHPTLLADVRAALFAARRDNTIVEAKNVRVRLNTGDTAINLTVRPVAVPEAAWLVIFEETTSQAPSSESVVTGDKAMESVIRSLEDELRHIKEQLRNTIEEYETSTEEQKASNEELQAVNEELRSATEELETSKEELQSVNEELTTVNNELKNNVDQLSRVNSDLQNLMQSTDIGTVFLDRDLKIKRFTPRIAEIFNVIASDVGRPISNLTHNLTSTSFERDAAKVLQTLKPVEYETRTTSARIYLVRIVPYRSLADKIEGVVAAFIDITERKLAEAALRETQERMRLIIESAKDYAIFTSDLDRNVNSWNGGARAMFGFTDQEIMGKSTDILFVPEDRSAGIPEKEARRALEFGRAENERWHVRKDGSRLYGSGLVMPLRDDAGHDLGTVKIMRDLTVQKRAEEALGRSEEQFRRAIEDSPIPVIMHAEDGAVLQISRTWTELTGYTLEHMAVFDSWLNYAYGEGEGVTAVRAHMQKLFSGSERIVNIDFPIKTLSGELRHWSFSASSPGTLRDGRRFIVGMALDITERKQMEQDLVKSRDQLEQRVDERTAELAQANESLAAESAERVRVTEERLSLLKQILTVQEDERRRIARDMHDQFGQQITALRLKLDAVQKLSEGDLKEKLMDTQEIAQALDANVNFLVWELRPTALDDLGLKAAVEHYVRKWSENFDISAAFHGQKFDDREIGADVATNLYRIVQEALNNTAKHANARNASVIIEKRDSNVIMVVEDDGRGFDILHERRGGLGVKGMHERSELVGGTFQIESSPGKGTTVYISMPLKSSLTENKNGS